jgi:hypothetical protein
MKYRIEQDTDATSPSDWEHKSLFIVANHRDCYIPEPGQKRIPSDPAEVVGNWKRTHWVFGLEAYIHSGVVLALSGEGNFPDRQWDVSQLGFVFVAKKEWRLRKSARKAALSKVAEWNQYLSGDVWGCIVEDDDGNEVDSCWGFYGREYAESEGKRMLDAAIAAAEVEADSPQLALALA